jgi:hypothetical protein
MKLGWIMACRSRCASHHPSLSSVLCPFRAFTSCAFARYTFTVSSSTLNTGFQYDPVLSITTWLTASFCNQSRSCSNSATVVSNRRFSTRGSPSSGPIITHTDNHFFPTHVVLLEGRENGWRRFRYVLPRLDCSIRGFTTSTWPVSFSGPTAHHYPFRPSSPASSQHNPGTARCAHIFITGGGRPPVILFRLVWRGQFLVLRAVLCRRRPAGINSIAASAQPWFSPHVLMVA